MRHAVPSATRLKMSLTSSSGRTKKFAFFLWPRKNECAAEMKLTELYAFHFTSGPVAFSSPELLVLNTERSYKWRLSGSAGQSEIGILCFDWLIHPGVSYSREICNFSGEFVIFQATAEGKIFRLFAFFLKRSAKTTRMTSTEHEFRHLHLIYMHFNLLFSLFHL